MRVLLSEGHSLTAREFITALGPRHHLEVMDRDSLCLARWSRWTRRIHRCPPSGTDPIGYLDAVGRVLAEGRFDVLLPTHEQAWLFSVARERLPRNIGLAVAEPGAFARVQSKTAFALLADELQLRQPCWALVRDGASLHEWPYPYYLKAPFSTAGRGVRQVRDPGERDRALAALARAGRELMVQAAVPGTYCQVQALFDRGRLVAAHTSSQIGTGMGGSAAARISVDHEAPRRDVKAVGAHLGWHGGLTLDYVFDGTVPCYIECNPRTVEPGNAVASGINIPEAQLLISAGKDVLELPRGLSGVRTHGLVALILGNSPYDGRWGVLRRVLRAALGAASSTEALSSSRRSSGTPRAASR